MKEFYNAPQVALISFVPNEAIADTVPGFELDDMLAGKNDGPTLDGASGDTYEVP